MPGGGVADVNAGPKERGGGRSKCAAPRSKLARAVVGVTTTLSFLLVAFGVGPPLAWATPVKEDDEACAEARSVTLAK